MTTVHRKQRSASFESTPPLPGGDCYDAGEGIWHSGFNPRPCRGDNPVVAHSGVPVFRSECDFDPDSSFDGKSEQARLHAVTSPRIDRSAEPTIQPCLTRADRALLPLNSRIARNGQYPQDRRTGRSCAQSRHRLHLPDARLEYHAIPPIITRPLTGLCLGVRPVRPCGTDSNPAHRSVMQVSTVADKLGRRGRQLSQCAMSAATHWRISGDRRARRALEAHRQPSLVSGASATANRWDRCTRRFPCRPLAHAPKPCAAPSLDSLLRDAALIDGPLRRSRRSRGSTRRFGRQDVPSCPHETRTDPSHRTFRCAPLPVLDHILSMTCTPPGKSLLSTSTA